MNAAGLQLGHGVFGGGHAAHRQVVQGAGAGFDGIRPLAGAAFLRDEQRMGAHALGAARDGADVAHVGDAVQQQQQRDLPCLKDARQHLRDGLIGHGGHKGHHALVGAAPGELVELFGRDKLGAHPGLLQLGTQLNGVAAIGALQQ